MLNIKVEKRNSINISPICISIFTQSFLTCIYYRIPEKNKDKIRYRRPVSSVGRAPDFCAGGLGFEPRPDQHSGS